MSENEPPSPALCVAPRSEVYGWIVELQPGCWLAPWEGDPGRTLVKASAQVFDSPKEAGDALDRASDFREWTNPGISRVPLPNVAGQPRDQQS